MHSLWEQTPASSGFETLRQDIETDVLIIGGGMAGVLCAYLLQQAGVSYIGPYSGGTTDLYVCTGFNKWGMTSSMASAMILCDLVQGKENPYAEVFSPSRTILRPQLAANALEAAVGLLTPTARRCPHLGCALKWNPYERTWDCSCHGSRFTETGRLIDNPATGDLKKSPRK